MAQKETSRSGIAIIGMACVYPGAHSPEELWQNVLAGRRQFRKFPDERLPRALYVDADPDAPGKSYADQMAVITGWSFDPVAFRIPPVTFQTTDIAHWLALHTAREALQDAGIDPGRTDRSRFAVMIGNTLTGEFSRTSYLRFRWPYVERSIRSALLSQGFGRSEGDALLNAVAHYYLSPFPEINEDTLAGNMSNTIAGRICGHFDLGGGGFTVDGACSSSLLAIAHACNALVDGDLDIVLTGGVDVSLDPFEIVGFAKTKALAEDDIRPYDERAAGMLPGEGCGMFVLMREDRARAEGRPVHAVIRGWGYSSDGSGGITAPRVEGQMRAVRKAYERAGYGITDVGLFEGHGTGTALGDKVEIEALRNLIDAAGKATTAWIGSIKGDIGHCKAAAGAAGLIKAVMALKRRIIPPTGNCAAPHAVFGRPLGALRPALAGQAWETGGQPRRAAVSAMGFGGANAHITIEEADGTGSAAGSDLALLCSARPTELVMLSGTSPEDLAQKTEAVLRTAGRISRAELVDLAAALAREDHRGVHRLAVIAESPWQLADRLGRVAEGLRQGKDLSDMDDPDSGVFAGRTKKDPWFAALYPGQASQRINMGRDLFRAYRSVGDLAAAVEASIADIIPGGLTSRLRLDPAAFDEVEWRERSRGLQDTSISQPSIVLVSLAATMALSRHGLRPGLCLGHSLGEISALCAAGAIDEVAAVRIAALRGRIMASLGAGQRGAMAAIGADRSAVSLLLEAHAPGLTISNYNSPRQTVVSGLEEEIERLVAACRNKEIRAVRLPVSHAFHSPLVHPAAEEFRQALQDVEFRAPSLNVLSSVTARSIDRGTDLRALLCEQITSPVRFMDVVLLAAEQAPDFWVEAGPGGVLTGLVRDILRDRDVECFSTDEEGQDNTTLLNRVFGRAFVLGCPLDIASLFAERFSRPIAAYNYDPVMIVNPCERPVQRLAGTAGGAGSVPLDLSPAGVEPGQFSDYLGQRRDYLREMIALDYRFHARQAVPQEPTAQQAPATPPAPGPEQDVVQYALDWIAKRTGYPRETLTASLRLRDDLNLDSIKAGELALILGRRMKLASVPDPGKFANSSIAEIVEHLGKSSGSTAATPAAAGSASPVQAVVGGLGDWNAAFRIQPVPSAPDRDSPLPFAKRSAALIVAPRGDQRAEALRTTLGEAGVLAQVADAQAEVQDIVMPAGLSVVAVILPEERQDFLSLAPDDFTVRVEGLASFLFTFFRRIAMAREDGLAGLRCVIARPYATDADRGEDLDGGAGFLKTLKLEHPGFDAKWVCVPAVWSAKRLGETIARELQTRSARVWFRYDGGGERFADAAVPVDGPAAAPADLSGGVMLVTGGAKGITFELASAFARQTGVALGLLGTSPAPDRSAGSAGSELLGNLMRLEEAGVRYRYVSCDVTDRDAVRTAIEEVQHALGPVTMVLHGAGLTRPAPFLQMEIRNYLECIRVKAQGLYNILSLLPSGQLRVLHVLSSVLGRTGMSGQADYTFANAWLDGAVQTYLRDHPFVRGFSLGYSVWSDAGLGKRMGAAATLGAMGVVPVSTERGIAMYLDLALNGIQGTFIGTGRLGPLDAALYAPLAGRTGRFTERVLRFIPGTEIITEAQLSHAQDRYLPEHMFQGTALMPGVMGIEAMVSAAMLCAGSERVPELSGIRFLRPLIVPEDAIVNARVYGLVTDRSGQRMTIRLAVRSEQDGYREDHFEAECLFGSELRDDPPRLAVATLPEAAPLPIGAYEPLPLFQGKLFRRITSVRERIVGSRSITEIHVPEDARYFGPGQPTATSTPAPAVRDSCLQSAGLILPEMCLPAGIAQIRWRREVKPGEVLLCVSEITRRDGDGYLVTIMLHDEAGVLVEELRDVLFRPTRTGPAPAERAVPAYQPLVANGSVFEPLFRDLAYAATVLPHGGGEALPHLSASADHVQLEHQGLAAARMAAVSFARARLGLQVSPERFSIRNEPSGKPRLEAADPSLAEAFQGIDLSLTDGAGVTMACIGRAPLGVDIEPVEDRSAELWLGLLGEDGYGLARSIAGRTGEPFDVSATRVWTLIESGKKATALQRIVPTVTGPAPEGWMALTGSVNGTSVRFYSTVVALDEGSGLAAISFASGAGGVDRRATAAAEGTDALQERLDEEVRTFFEGIDRFAALSAHDPQHRDTEEHYRMFHEYYSAFPVRLQRMAAPLPAGTRRGRQLDLSRRMLAFIRERTGSVCLRRALEKPLGYPGDYLLMDMMVKQEITATGLGYHCDRSFIEYSGSEGVRHRTSWAADRLRQALLRNGGKDLTVLDLGCGPMTIEKLVAESAAPDARLRFLGLDIDAQAISYARSRISGANRSIEIRNCNLLGEDGLRNVGELAPAADICICMGFFDYLDPETISLFLEDVRRRLQPGTPVLFANYQPDHAARPAMEWLLDWWIVYKSEQEMRKIAENAGFRPEAVRTSLEPSGSIVLVEATA